MKGKSGAWFAPGHLNKDRSEHTISIPATDEYFLEACLITAEFFFLALKGMIVR